MTRIYVGLLALALVVSLCACNGESALSDPAPSTTTTATMIGDTTTITAPTTTAKTLITKPIGTITTTSRPTPQFSPGEIRLVFAVEATERYTEADYSASALSERFGIHIDYVEKRWQQDAIGSGAAEGKKQTYMRVHLKDKSEQAMKSAVNILKQHTDISYAGTVKASMFVGEVYIDFTVEATQCYTAEDYTPSALSKSLGLTVIDVIEACLVKEYSNEGKPTERYVQRILIVTDTKDEPSTKAAVEKIRNNKDVLFANINPIYWIS